MQGAAVFVATSARTRAASEQRRRSLRCPAAVGGSREGWVAAVSGIPFVDVRARADAQLITSPSILSSGARRPEPQRICGKLGCSWEITNLIINGFLFVGSYLVGQPCQNDGRLEMTGRGAKWPEIAAARLPARETVFRPFPDESLRPAVYRENVLLTTMCLQSNSLSSSPSIPIFQHAPFVH